MLRSQIQKGFIGADFHLMRRLEIKQQNLMLRSIRSYVLLRGAALCVWGSARRMGSVRKTEAAWREAGRYR
jgi:hypothetical protein